MTWRCANKRRAMMEVRALGRPSANRAVELAVSFLAAIIVGCFALGITLAVVSAALARDLDGRYAQSDLKPWFDKLRSAKALCCSFADGVSIRDVDWDTQDGRYRVRLDGKWIVVPDDAVIHEANRFGPAVVWPYQAPNGETLIRCFIPGAGT